MNQMYVISKHNQMVLLKESSILYMLAVGAYTLFKTDNGDEHLVTKNLKTCFSKIINKDLFVRTHRSCFLNKSCNMTIEKAGPSKMVIVINNGDKLPVNDTFIRKIRKF